MQASLCFKGLLRFREFIASRANRHIRLGRMRMPINRAAVNARTITMGRGSRPVVLDWRCGPSFSKMSYFVAEFQSNGYRFRYMRQECDVPLIRNGRGDGPGGSSPSNNSTQAASENLPARLRYTLQPKTDNSQTGEK